VASRNATSQDTSVNTKARATACVGQWHAATREESELVGRDVLLLGQ
jgi:hypothetical protein